MGKRKNNKGIGLLIVLSAISLLTIIMVGFTYDSKINLINSNNMQNRSQAKLNAESGLRWTLVMMNIYKDLFNKIQLNEQAKNMVTPETLNILWSTPFVFPVPAIGKTSISQKNALDKFNSENFIQGELNVSVKNLSGKLNLNLLRFSLLSIASQDKLNSLYDGDYYQNTEKDPSFAKQFKLLLDNIIQEAIESDEKNDDLENIDTEELVNNIIYYTTDPIVSTVSPCPTCSNSQQSFNAQGIVAKKAPLTDISELYLIPGWNDKLVKLIQNHVTVHGAIVIDVSQITSEILKLIMPEITAQEIADFYKYKNDPDTLDPLNTIASIRRYFTTNTGVAEKDFNDKVTELEKSGIIFGSSASLFEVKSVGKLDRATYSITAIVTLPPLPKPKAEEKKQPQGEPFTGLFTGQQQQQQNKKDEEIEYPDQLLKPRVIYFSIN